MMKEDVEVVQVGVAYLGGDGGVVHRVVVCPAMCAGGGGPAGVVPAGVAL